MFGNILPDKNELTLKNYTDYRAYYCGLCRSMGGKLKGFCNLGLSYEAVFIALIISAVKEDKVKAQMQRCILHPFHKRPVAVESDGIDTAAAVNVLMMYNKFCDDIKDEKSITSALARQWLKKPYRRAAQKLPEINAIINDKLDDLSLTEESLCDILDMAAAPFSEMMGEIAEKLMPEKNEDMYWFGFFLGKWLYVLDAFADIERDVKTGSYNPFVLANRDASSDEVRKNSKDDCAFVLNSSLDELAKLYKKLDFKRNNALIENILFCGMPKRTEEVLSGEKKKKTKEYYIV